MMVQKYWGMGAVFAAVFGAATAVSGETVNLRTADDSLILTGELEEFDGTFYFLRTRVGLLRVDAASILCEGAGCPELEPPAGFNVSGSTELARTILPQVLTGYARSAGIDLEQTETGGYSGDIDGEADAEIAVTASASADGIQDLIQGRSSVVLSTRAVTPEERAALDTAGRGPIKEYILAIEGLVIVTAPGNSLPSISVKDAAQIFSGGYANWSELGGPDAPINVYARPQDAAISEVFSDLVLAPDNQSLSGAAEIVSDESSLSAKVAADPNGIGFTRFASTGDTRALPIIGVCGLVVTPNEFNIKTEEYPLSHRHHVYAAGAKDSEFLDGMFGFLEAGGAENTVLSAGMLGQELTRGPVDQQGMRFASALKSETVIDALPLLQQMVEEMIVSERLSATLRFETGSSVLDNRARKDIARVAQLLERETADGSRKIARIMGFTDSLGNPDLNRELSVRRARQVSEALLAVAPGLADNVELRPMGFGDVSPIGCDETSKGRWTNRRVEIWLSNAAR